MKATKPIKAEGSLFNTWLVDIDGAYLTYDDEKIKSENRVLTVRFTSDSHETLSIADELRNIQMLVPFKKVEELIECARGVRNESNISN